MARRFIALELESAALHLAVATIDAQGPKLLEERTLSYGSREELAELLRGLQQELEPGLIDSVELQLPATSGYARLLEYPFSNRRKLAGVVPPDFFYRLPVDSEGLEHDILPQSEGELTRVAVTAISRDKLREVSELFAEAELPLGRVSMLPWGLGVQEGTPSERALLAWLRDDEAGIALCEAGDLRRFAVDAGVQSDLRGRSGWLLQQAEKLERLEGWEGLTIRLFGGDAELQQQLEHAGREVERYEAGSSRVARLALAGVKGRKPPTHNLLKGDLAPTGGWQELRSRLRFSLGLALTVLLLGLIGIWSGYQRQAKEAERLERQAEQLLLATFPEIGRVHDDAQMQLEGQLRSLRMKAGARSEAQGAPLELLRAMSRELPEGVGVVLDEWTLASGEVRLEGSTTSFEQVDRLAEAFGKLPGVAQASVAESKTASDGRVAFRMRLVLGESR